MLKGLEVNEVKLSSLERSWRLDAEFYSKIHFNIDELLKANQALPLSNNFAKVSDGNHMGISNEFLSVGIPYYRGGEVRSFFLEMTPPNYCISEEVFLHPVMKRSHLRKNDVLVTIVGTIGNITNVVTDEKATCSCKIAILRPKNSKYSFFLGAFLNSRYGQIQFQRMTRGSVQMGFILDDFDLLLVPKFSEQFIEYIDNIVEHAYNLELSANKCYSKAEQALLKELGLVDWSPIDKAVSIKSYLDFVSAKRFDAEYFQLKYDEYAEHIKSYKGGYNSLSFFVKPNTTSFKKNLPEYQYIEISDVNIGNGNYTANKIAVDDLPDNAKIKVQDGDVIISKVRPNRGAVSIIKNAPENLVVSSAFTVVSVTGDIYKETLLVLLRTWLYKDWFLKWTVGSSYPVIKDENILNIPIPAIDKTIQHIIVTNVQKSNMFLTESKRLLDLAKRAIEIAMEQNEGEAIKLLNAEKKL